MIKTIEKNSQYELQVDAEKNRAYLKIIGYWRNAEQVPNYIKHWRQAVSLLKPGFTLLTDASEMKTHPADVKKLHYEAQQLITKEGVSHVAEIQSNVIVHAQLDSVANESKMPKRNFKNLEEAEEFLNSLKN